MRPASQNEVEQNSSWNIQPLFLIQQMMEKEEFSRGNIIDQILCNIIGYSQENGNLLTKYNDEFYLAYFDRLKIDETIKKVPVQHKQLEICEFVRLFLSVIEHKTDETLYLTISLTKLYKKIKEETNNEKGVKFSDFTSFLCNKISEGDPDLVIATKQTPLQRVVPDVSKVRDIDVHPPPILNKAEVERPKITKDKTKKDKKLEQKKPVAKFIYSQSLKSIITLGRLSSSITLYDPKDLHVQHKIIPSTCKLMSKDVAILSIAYCEREQRIGCIINNIGITFWQAADNFSTEKILGANKSDYDPKNCGDRIYYLGLFQQWVTTDRNTLFFWDIKEEVITKTIHKPGATTIHDICQVNHLRALLVSYNIEDDNKSGKASRSKFDRIEKSQEKILVLYQDGKLKSKLVLENPGCHSISYNPSTQLVICLGYQSNICVYEIDTKTLDINLVTQLQAHSSILTCVSNLPDTSMIVSGDDIGHLKLWDLNYMRCLQSIKIAKSLTQLSCSDGMLVYADSRINIIPMDGALNSKFRSKQKDEESYGIYEFFRKEEETLWVITRKQAREIDIRTGRIINVLVLCNAEEDISAAAELYNGFLIGTSRGEICKYTLDGERKWRIVAHQGEVHAIKVDLQNHLVVTIGGDNNLYIWPEKTITEEEGPRKKISFNQRDINILEVCPFANLLLIGSTNQKVVTIWNYDNLKLAYKIEFPGTITTLKILNDKQIFLVTTATGCVQVFMYARKEAKLKISLVTKFDINNVMFGEFISEEQSQEQSAPHSDQRTYVSKVAHCEDSNMIVFTTPKGTISCFEPTHFMVNCNYRREYEPTPILKRPMKESFEHELLKKQFIEYDATEMQMLPSKARLSPLWQFTVHKDAISFLDIINLEKKYACTLCIDGYFKLVELSSEQGSIVCSHKISFPLPVKWEIDVQNYCDLKNQIHEAIAVIDSIIKTYSYELTLKEQANLNLTQFMEKMMFSEDYEVKKLEQCPHVMKEEFSQADVKQVFEKPITLKNLEAYKRLQLIKKQNEPNSCSKPNLEVPYHYETSVDEKQSIRKLLEPNYLPKLLNKNITEAYDCKRSQGNDLVSRLEEALQSLQNKRAFPDRQKDKENKFALSLLSRSHVKQDSTVRRNGSYLCDGKESFVRDKSIKQILSSINSKLNVHKKYRNKHLDSLSSHGTL